MAGRGLMPFQGGKSSNPFSLFGDKIGRWMGKVLPPILPAPAALSAQTTTKVVLKNGGGRGLDSPLPSFLDSSFKILYIPGEIQAFCSYTGFGYITHYLLTIFFLIPCKRPEKHGKPPPHFQICPVIVF